MSNPLVFELVLDPAETVRAGQEIERRDPSWQSWRLWAFWLLIPLTMIVAFRWPIRALGAVLGAAIFAGLVALLTPALRRRRVRRTYAATPALAGPQRYEFTDVAMVLNVRGARGDEGGHLHWEWSDDVGWEARVSMSMSSGIANLYFQGEENVAIAIARRRIVAGGDVKAALSLLPLTEPVHARYRALVARDYPHLAV